MPHPLRIANHSAAWGDTVHAARQLVDLADPHILTGDYLAEVTMALLARARLKDPEAGFVPDWLAAVAPVLPHIKARGIRLVTNAGGMNPPALARAFAAEAARQGLSFRVATITGDDLLPALKPTHPGLASANAYLGATPIAAALAQGAEVVITGRTVDSALALGPLIAHFGWAPDDWDRLAQGALAGHVIECGAQATGGLFTDWRSVEQGWSDIGFPVVEVQASGDFTLEKPPGTGGLIAPLAVAEQILYEIGDPAAYRLPDVCCDFTGVRLAQDGARVRVGGARGRPPGPHYKVCTTAHDGWRLLTTLMIAGGDAGARGRAAGQALIARARRHILAAGHADFRDTSVEVIGAGDVTGRPSPAPEVVVKIGARHDDPRALEILARDFAHPGVAMAQGITGALFGRPRPQPVLRVHALLWPKAAVTPLIDGVPSLGAVTTPEPVLPPPAPWPAPPPPGPRLRVPLRRIAVGRSGDKGDDANIGLIARDPALWPVLADQATEALAARTFAHLGPRGVRRWALPGMQALNLVLEGVLGGGGTASLRYDPQGKTFAQILLDAEIEVPASLLTHG
jgi:hypothetical protein